MDNFTDNNILIFCPKCSRPINVISFNFKMLNSKKNLFFDYFCMSCYEYELKIKNEKNNHNTKENTETNKISQEKIIRDNTESISLINYLKQFFYKPKTNCKKHKHNKMCLFYNNKNKEYCCILCVLEKNEKITRNILSLNNFIKIHYATKKPCITNIRVINKESDCIKCIVSISPYILCYVIDKRCCVWDYSLNKILYSFVETNYIQNIRAIKMYKKENTNKKMDNPDENEFDRTNLLLTYGSSLRLWNLENVEKSKTPLLFQDNYCIIQEAIQIYNENLIAFLSEDGLFIWDFTKENKKKKYSSDELNNVIPLSDLTSVFLYQINESILSFGTANKVYLYDYKYKIKNYIFTDNDNEEITFGKNLSFSRLALVIKPNKLIIYQINTILDEEEKNENDIYKYNNKNDDEEKKKMKINFERIYETEINLGDDYWKFYLEEINDMYLIGFFDKNEVYLIDIFSDDKEILYKYNEDKVNVDKNKRKIGITKIKYLGKNKICLLINNESLNLFDIDKKIIVTTFTNQSYGQISTFKKLHNGDIAFGQIKQEYFYSIGILE